MKRLCRSALVGTAVALIGATFGDLLAQPYPVRAVHIVVPYPPGGANDVLARLIAQPLAPALKTSVVVDNKPGGNAAIGSEYVAKAAPDGYTMLLGSQATHAANPHLIERPRYNALTDFTPVAMIGEVNGVLVVNPSVPVDSVRDLIAYARANPGKINFGHPGVGTPMSLAGELFKIRTGVNIVAIPYKGGAQVNSALLAGDIHVIFANTPSVLRWIQQKRIRALGVTSSTRDPLLPDVAPIAELGVPGYDMTNWFGLFLPANTPGAIVARLNAEVRSVIRAPELKKKLMDLGAIPVDLTAEQFSAYVKKSYENIGTLIKAANLKPE
ncbi:MAG: hypothetical protein A3G81_23415 [Betaproteobacteria bacterium RIFCSPLOWO2_12_FULL_65_14]|nr:MAG: hypothetical protein A3G81_23415 [Betaproteobacteria bacterium RIFCSPLOWO2_12_FULL_65_14]